MTWNPQTADLGVTVVPVQGGPRGSVHDAVRAQTVVAGGYLYSLREAQGLPSPPHRSLIRGR